MTAETDATATSADGIEETAPDPDGFKSSDFEPHDWVLDSLLAMTVDSGVDNNLGLSVVSGGLLISGIAIHREKWLELFAAQIRNAGTDGSTEPLANAIEIIIGGQFTHINEMLDRRLQAELQRPPSHFLHFRDARVHAPQYSDYPLFRVLIEDVTAWSLGSHNVSDKNE